MRLDEIKDTVDKVTMDVPLLIRLLEMAREDIKSDAELHNVATSIIKLSKTNRMLTMKHYEDIETALK